MSESERRELLRRRLPELSEFEEAAGSIRAQGYPADG